MKGGATMDAEYYLVEGCEGPDYFVSADDITPEELELECNEWGESDHILGAFDNIADGIDLIGEQHYSDEDADDLIACVKELDLPEN